MSEEHKELAARIALEVFNEGRIDVVDEVVHRDFIDHSNPLPGASPDREGLKTMAVMFRQTFPDLHNTITHSVAEADLVVQHVTSTGTMRGELMGMQPTGKAASWEAIHIVRFRDGKLAEHWAVADQLGMLQQLGLAQMPGQRQPA